MRPFAALLRPAVPLSAVLVAAVVASACSPGRQPVSRATDGSGTPRPATITARPVSGLSVLSLVSSPPGGDGGAWTFDPDVEDFDVAVRLRGTGTVTVRLRLQTRPAGVVVHSDEQSHELSGDEFDVAFGGVGPLEAGDYTLTLEVVGPGIRQSQSVSVTRR